MSVPLYQVDAFTDAAFAGNPAAVVLLEAPASERWMQAVAREMNLSETAFVVTRDEGFDLRWFTPSVEVELCGHATLASAHVLWEIGRISPTDAARFHTASGILTARKEGDGINLDFPSTPPTETRAPPGLAEALGVDSRWVGKTRFDLLVLVDGESSVRELAPDIPKLARLPVRGVMVTARADESSPSDFVSRFFAPAAGVDEDPVTGSAHCALAPFWAGRLSRTELIGYQASPRGGFVRVRVSADRVELGGRCVTVLRGELLAAS